MQIGQVATVLILGSLLHPTAEAQQVSPEAVAIAQPPVPAAPARVRRWEITVGTGVAYGGPAADLEDAMRRADLDDTMIAWSSPIAFPYSTAGFNAIGRPLVVEARCRVMEFLSVGLSYSDLPMGATSGYQDPSQHMEVHYAVTSVTALAAVGPPIMQIGIGPSLHVARARNVNLGEAEPWGDQTKLGFTAQGRLQLPIGRRFFIALTLEYRFVGQASVGPYTTEGRPGHPVTLPATDVTYTHRYFGIGSGIRF